MSMMDVRVLSGNAVLKDNETPVFYWEGETYGEGGNITFKRAYMIETKDMSDNISDLTFQVHDREFQNFSFARGRKLKENDLYEIRKHKDRTIFIFRYTELPTFDEGDRTYGSDRIIVLYEDAEGINLIECTYGYVIRRIEVYIGMINSNKSVDKCLEKLRGRRGIFGRCVFR